MKLLAVVFLVVALAGGALYLFLSRMDRAIERDFLGEGRYKP